MTLRGVHLIFVTAAVLLTSIFGVWSYQQFRENKLLGYLATAIVSWLLAIGLIFYGKNFAQKNK